MAAPDATAARPGEAYGGSSDPLELFLKVFSGEVITAFERQNIMMDRHMVRTIKNGKSAQFPKVWRATAEMHTPGTLITGNSVEHAEREISIDGLLIAPIFIANIDEAMNHYDVRSIYSTEAGRILGMTFDENVMKEIVKGAAASSQFSDAGVAGTVIIDEDFDSSTLATQAEALAEGLFTAAKDLDEEDVPMEGRTAIFPPSYYYALVQSAKAINKDFGGRGSYANGDVLRIAGFEVLKSNNVPTTNTTGSDSYHGVDASDTCGIMFGKQAAGTVKLLDLKVESEYDITRQGTWIVAKYAVGHGYLRQEACISFDHTA